jgi:hypothetical protein
MQEAYKAIGASRLVIAARDGGVSNKFRFSVQYTTSILRETDVKMRRSLF